MTLTSAAVRPATITPARAAIGVGAALVVNVLVFLAGDALGATFDVGQAQPASLVAVAVSTVVPLAIGLVVVGLVARRRPSFRRFAAWAGLVVAVLSTAAPFTMAAETTTAATLALMHLVVGATWFTLTRPAAAR
ncbi:DUF6069 family protein [Actinotalea solisilvae]|uniref:DUF6069 family protein n=1 Tax=Actinotalea solisilvae TaxID=2072922 RepID=UPI0018F24C09|nr:DUF6069 family protein [Actinotalea solisilvae]